MPQTTCVTHGHSAINLQLHGMNKHIHDSSGSYLSMENCSSTDLHAKGGLTADTSVRPSTPFSADTDTPIFCCQSNTIPIF